MSRIDSATSAIALVRRASATDRYAHMCFDVEWRPLAELSFLIEDWRALAARALEPNVFYDPAFALAAAPLLGNEVRSGLVWSRSPRQLVGFFPVRTDRRRYGLPFPVMVGWTHPYAPLGTPLVDRELAEPVIASWLDHVARDPALPDMILVPLIAQSGPFAAVLADALARRGCVATSFGRHERALLLPDEHRDDYLQRHVSGKRLRNIRRRQRQLAENGAVSVDEARDGEALIQALTDYFAIEAAGWKGRAGTAAAQNKAVRDFMRQAISALGADGKVLIHRLLVQDEPIAATIALKSGNAAWGWKVSYDEAYAGYSPGVLAVAELTKTLLADPTIAQADSCAGADDTMASHLWTQHLTMADWLFTTQPGAEFSFRLASRLETLRRAAIAAAKSARDRLRGR